MTRIRRAFESPIVIVFLIALVVTANTAVVLKTHAAAVQKPRPTFHERVLHNILYFESSHGRYCVGKNGERGPAQFKRQTFRWMSQKAGMPWLEWQSAFDQVVLLSWAVRNGYGNHWTTYSKSVRMAEAEEAQAWR